MPTDNRTTKTVIKNGYEYTLIKVPDRRNLYSVRNPCFMGFPGWALAKCEKVKKQ